MKKCVCGHDYFWHYVGTPGHLVCLNAWGAWGVHQPYELCGCTNFAAA